MTNKSIVTILVDNESWILPYAGRLEENLNRQKIDTRLVRNAEDIREGWICFILGCTQIVKAKYLSRNKHNLVVHESDLPKGRGFSPMTWQILEGKNSIPICLLEASIDEPDAGDIWLRDVINLDGCELLPDWRKMQGERTIELCMKFIRNYECLKPKKQTGSATYYKRRTPRDSELDPNKTIAEQLNLIRVVDNDRYPAFVILNGNKFIIKVE